MPRPSLSPQVAARILDYVRERGLSEGQHLPSQQLADAFRVSRAPINAALKELERAGLVRSEPNRGYFLARDAGSLPAVNDVVAASPDAEDELYARLVEDRLGGRLTERVSEAELMRAYGVARGRLVKVLYRAADEGWMERLPGNGWTFRPMLTSREAYERSYQFRASIEGEALRLASFVVDAAAFKVAREEQGFILEGGHRTMTRAELFRANSAFHEMLAACSGNDFFLDAVRRVNRLRRLIEFRVTVDRSRLPTQSREHLTILDLIEAGQREAAAAFLRQHILGAGAIKSPHVG